MEKGKTLTLHRKVIVEILNAGITIREMDEMDADGCAVYLYWDEWDKMKNFIEKERNHKGSDSNG